jgi:hypothetical protein
MKGLTVHLAVLVALGANLGCAKPAGPARFQLSGRVTLDGQSIPYGEVVFTPDASKKNSGPQGIAPIRDGKFDTAAAGGMGIAGGPTIIRVNGMSGPGGKTLCEYEMPVDLPRQDGTHDIAVPKNGAAKPGVKATEI